MAFSPVTVHRGLDLGVRAERNVDQAGARAGCDDEGGHVDEARLHVRVFHRAAVAGPGA